MTPMPTVLTMMVVSCVPAREDTLEMGYTVKVFAQHFIYAYERSYIYMYKSWRILMLIIHSQISMSVRWIMIVMKRMECALTLMDLISVPVKWDSDSMAMASTAVVSHVYLDVVCL